MSDPRAPGGAPGPAGTRYEIRVAGVIDDRWASWFGGLGIADDGDATVISGVVADQAALHGLLTKVRDIGLTLISVSRQELAANDPPSSLPGRGQHPNRRSATRIPPRTTRVDEIHPTHLERDEAMHIAVVGGTGTLGRLVALELRSRGHEVRSLSRRDPEHPIDLTTGAGLEQALAGCDVVVDAANDPSGDAAATLVEGCRRLLAAEAAAGVGHHVGISVIGCERVPMDYFRAKAEQERLVATGLVPWSLVRATQFHEFVASLLASGTLRYVLPIPNALVQPVAAAEVAHVVADVAEGSARLGATSVAGPEIVHARELERTWRDVTGRKVPPVALPLPVPGELGRALRAGALTLEMPDIHARTTFAAWLRGHPEPGHGSDRQASVDPEPHGQAGARPADLAVAGQGGGMR